MPDDLLVGLMSGTSMDAIDAVLARIGRQGFELLDCHEQPMPAALRQRIHTLSHPGENEIHSLGMLDRELGECFADTVNSLLAKSGTAAGRVRAIGSHGQTVRHHPPSMAAPGEKPYTLQLGDPNTIAELTGITTVADFRRRDLAAGGEAAPLVPAFHDYLFGHTDKRRAVVNIGGIANASLLLAGEVSGFDTGPGNTLLDQWIYRHRGEHYDPLGAWSAEGEVQDDLLTALAAHPYLQLAPPKSTGKEVFNLAWLDAVLEAQEQIAPQDVQASLAEFTAQSIADSLAPFDLDEVYICGGGASNTDLMRRLYRRLSPINLGSTAELGCDPAWVEAAAFAWLAWQTLEGLPGNVPAVTGAAGPRVLGAIFPGS
ncbi:MAG: anhydro-N-acetylmuramic acid kinase [Halieaceae bacterium]|nr:anhydro-N-acetylmuramic acid kinase [Halieaceae bacterium]